jgi:hypothetical protein
MKPKTPIRTKRRAAITPQDVNTIATLVAKRLTETEACEAAGINPETWCKWKRRHGHDARYVRVLTRARARYVARNLKEIEKAAAGKDGVRHDWRAADRLNQIAKPEAYAVPLPAESAPVFPALPVTVNVWLDAAAKVVSAPAQPAIECGEVKQLTDAPVEAPPTPQAAVEKPCPLPAHWRERRREAVRVPVKHNPPSFEI